MHFLAGLCVPTCNQIHYCRIYEHVSPDIRNRRLQLVNCGSSRYLQHTYHEFPMSFCVKVRRQSTYVQVCGLRYADLRPHKERRQLHKSN